MSIPERVRRAVRSGRDRIRRNRRRRRLLSMLVGDLPLRGWTRPYPTWRSRAASGAAASVLTTRSFFMALSSLS